MSQVQEFERAVRAAIAAKNNPTIEEIAKTIDMFASIYPMLSEEQVSQVKREIEQSVPTTMTFGVALSNPFKPWIENARANIDWFYWERYRDYLIEQKGFGSKLVNSLSEVTEKILGLAENPQKPGAWERRGMVVGQVQSGKTSNYLGLITKAADAGYKVFIVIAGVTNSLRKQTQMRVDEGFIGFDVDKKPVGVKGYSDLSKLPFTVTNTKKDFNKATANQVMASVQSISAPRIFVIKKNSNTLQNLIEWLQQSVASGGNKITDVPMMLIDDEADNASVNTKKDPNEATKINACIRQLLNLFTQKCYIGYTATPFANIFIDDSKTEAHQYGKNLFPEDFIYCLDAPSNYCGADKIFGEDSDFVRIIDDHQDADGQGILPVAHRKDFEIKSLPDSLIRAINSFVLVRAIRILRGDANKHNSMLINVSRFNSVQDQIRQKVSEYIASATDEIKYNYKSKTAMDSALISKIKETFDQEYKSCGQTWKSILGILYKAISPICVRTINQGSADALDYENYEEGLNIIAVGGFALSRGLTLEGLSISYLIRNTMMYDTLMQMGRWFGYRNNYEDLCKIYMPAEALSWYEFITSATNEMVSEFKYMSSLSLSPKNFGLRVKKSPLNLLITAKNKMRTGVDIKATVDLSGRYIETKRVFIREEERKENERVFVEFIKDLEHRKQSLNNGSYIWQGVPASKVLDFIQNYHSHGSAWFSQKAPIHRFIKDMYEKYDYDTWDVALFGLKNPIEDRIFKIDAGEVKIQITKPLHTMGKKTADGLGAEVSSQRRFASQGIEVLGLSPEEVQEANNKMKDGCIDNKDEIYRSVRKRPLLVLFVGDLKDKNTTYTHVPIYALSFPFANDKTRDYEGVEYRVNQQYIRENYGDLESDEEDEHDPTR